MAGISSSERLRRIHLESLEEFDRVQSALRDERLQCLQDRRFYSVPGAQWEGPLGEQFENKPRYEFNKVHLAVIRIINEYRNNRISIDFIPKDGSEADELADACDGLLRADEQWSTAEEAYDNAFEESTGGGIGAWRLRAVYEDEEDDENERQRISIEPIFDADCTVFFNLDAHRQDKGDATKCWVLTPYTLQGYKAEFDDDPQSWPRIVHQSEFDWCTPRMVWVAEHYRVEMVPELVRYFRGLDEDAPDMKVRQSEIDDDPDMLDQLQATGFREVRQKKIRTRRVHKYIMSGGRILEDCGYVPGKHIPIIVTYGKRWMVEGIERCMGHVRLAKDAQRLINMLMSWLAEMAGRFDLEKPILTPEQVSGHAAMWAQDNIKKYPYLLLNAMTDEAGNRMPPNALQYTKAPNVPPAMAALAQIAEQALQDLLGNQQAGEQMQPNISGKVVELVQQRLDMQVFIYMSNLSKAMRRHGEVWLSMAKELIVENSRKMKVVDPNGNPGSTTMNQPAVDEETGEQIVLNDISQASLDVWVDVGPNSVSKRAATVRALTGVMQMTQDPQTQQILASLAMMNMEGEGLSDARDYFRRQLVQMGVVKPTKEEAAEMAQAKAGQQPDPQSQYLMAAAEQAQADAAGARAKTVETIASAHLKQAQAAKTVAETHGAHQQHAINAIEALRQASMPPSGMPDGPMGA